MQARPTQRVLLGVTGGIAAYKSAELVRLLVKSGRMVTVVMTRAASEFVGAATFQALSGRPVYSDLWDSRPPSGMAHIELTREADVMLVAPASADFLARLVHGRCDDLLTAACLARSIPLIVCPAMNRQMWEHPATQRNVAQLKADGVVLFGPGTGEQACGEVGDGRMWEPEQILEALEAWAQPKRLAGRRVLVTAGPTQEPIDPVRVITNHSSGKMGFALARAAAEAGAEVTLVAGPVTLSTPLGVRRIDVTSAREMYEAVFAELDALDLFIAVAAVADYRPRQRAAQKIKKGGEPLTLTLEPTEDILAAVAERARARGGKPYCVGFAAESEQIEDYAEEKRRRKGIPLIVANCAQEMFGADLGELTLLDERGARRLPRQDKLALARAVVTEIAARLPNP
ncbi:MAG: bifunctional phosphopantothenoylcysteine decarboxylase/phosphopantothenate--cysteine ligase CoaBC [Casimicrobiaceae bacterium]|nr:bifunctional phosphopantothenoylcysteine decarboxylase/phosphopantothenate--cysteine ligase CoaBC [Casimicrobiaceae bacterium]MDW8311827.1 bifunctional phosphopantothenoylcysteine decarboxylase/phosphopantothenate--cysteine ligase CoaBC [Burkholderiales bacterium]